MKHRLSLRAGGFTLIELLIVVAILGFLATVVFVNLNPAVSQIDTRNARRLNDIGTLETAIQAYLLANNTAPNLLTDLVPNYIGSLPVDPSGGAQYSYCHGSTSAAFTTRTASYGLGATLEAGGTSATFSNQMLGSAGPIPPQAGGVNPAFCANNVTSGLIPALAGVCAATTATSGYYCRKSGS